ncbi:MAG: hypothetical protein QXJ28_01250, partial [Candidatus Pacearchaeota archaeon]
VEHIMSLCKNYREVARHAVMSGINEVYVPVEIDNLEDLIRALKNPKGFITLTTSNPEEKSEVYSSVKEMLSLSEENRFFDGYLVIDVLNKKVIDLRDKRGYSLLEDCFNRMCGLYRNSLDMAI